VNLRSTLGTALKCGSRKRHGDHLFAGHGATERDATSPDGDGLEKYCCPSIRTRRPLHHGHAMLEVARILNRIRSERLVFIADACYSGGSGGRTISVSGLRANIGDGFLERVVGGRGR